MMAGCSSSPGDGKPKPALSARLETPTPDPASAAPIEEPSTEASPDTPEEALDALGVQKGWTVDDSTYDSVSAYVQDICDSLPDSGAPSSSRPQWLAESGNMDGDGKAELQAGIPKLCPKWTATLKQAVSGDYPRWYGEGEFDVKANPKPFDPDSDAPQEMGAGTYRTTGDLSGCYWERTSQSGSIIDNQFATAARRITVTVRAGELFTSRDCGIWKPVE